MPRDQLQRAPAVWDPDRAFDALADRHRRRVLLALRDGSVDAVSDVLADETDRVALRHVHLPKLADGGYVEWDRETGALARGPNFADLEPLLAVLERHAGDRSSERP